MEDYLVELISSVVFFFVHYLGNKITLLDVFSAKEHSETKTDNFEAEVLIVKFAGVGISEIWRRRRN